MTGARAWIDSMRWTILIHLTISVAADIINMRVFKTRRFAREAYSLGISDAELMQAANEVAAGMWDADLGGGVYKKRLARRGQGKSGGFRVITLFNRGERLFFAHVFAKNDKANISKAELRDYKTAAKRNLSLPDAQIDVYVAQGSFIEITEDANGKRV